MYHICQHR